MEESLKGINLIHQLIIGVSAAIIAFSLSPDRTKLYLSALRDVTTLRQLSMKDYDEFAISLVPSTTQTEAQQYASALRGFGYERISDSFSTVRQVYVERPNDDAALAVFLRFFRDANQVVYVGFDPSTLLFDQSTAERKEMYRLIPGYCIPTRIVVDLNDTADPKNSVRLLSTPPQRETSHIYVSLSRDVGDMNCNVSIPGTIASLPITVAGRYGQNWLHSKGIMPESFMKHVETVADEIGSKSPAEAAKFLEDKVNAPKRELSFLGITVAQDTALWVGPFVTLLLMLFFLTHVRHVRVASDSKDKVLLKTFPWIALFPDVLSSALTYCSLAFLPLTANLILLLRSSDVMNRIFISGSVITSFVAVSCGFVAYEVRRLRTERVFDSPQKHTAAP